MPQTSLIAVRQEWQGAWHLPGFGRKVMVGMAIIIAILSMFPKFFTAIELRHGTLLNDPILSVIPPHNVSIPLFIVIWSITLLCIVRAAQTPQMFLTFLWAYIFLTIFRVLTITFVPLEAPNGLIALVDPLSNFFYGGGKFVTKDLFFSGHTSTIFLLYLTVPGKTEQRLALLATLLVAILLLIQHCHYTLDILGGIVFCLISYAIARKTVVKEYVYEH